MSDPRLAIAIDGPVAAGKTTVGGIVARRLDAVALDTGDLYRAVAHDVLQRGVDSKDDESVAGIAAKLDVRLRPPSVDDGRLADVVVNGRDVTAELRTPEIDRALPPIAANPAVRRALLEPQRRLASRGKVVVIGRDIGTVVLPDADFKFYIDAAAGVRAHRRFLELAERGLSVEEQAVRRDLHARDERDIHRIDAPLRPAEDAMIVDTTNRTAEEVADVIINHIRSGLRGGDGDD